VSVTVGIALLKVLGPSSVELLSVATGPVGDRPMSRRDQIVVVVTMYSAVTGFFAIGPTIASLMGEELDFEADGPLHLDLLQRYARVTVHGGDT